MALHRSLTVWAGILVFSFLVWLRQDALKTETTIGLRDFPNFAVLAHPGGFSFFKGALFHVGPASFIVVNSWDVFGTLDLDPVILIRNPVPRGYPEWDAGSRGSFTLGHGELFGAASLLFSIALLFRHRRIVRKRDILVPEPPDGPKSPG